MCQVGGFREPCRIVLRPADQRRSRFALPEQDAQGCLDELQSVPEAKIVGMLLKTGVF